MTHATAAPRPARGFTILELVVYVAVVGAVLTVAVSFLAEFSVTQQKTLVGAEVSHNARFAIARLSADVRDADGVNTGASVFDTNPGTLSISMPTPALDPTVYSVSGGRLFVQQGTGPAVALTSSKTQVTEFTLDDVSVSGKTRAVRVHLTLKNINVGNLVEQEAVANIETTVRIPILDGFGS